MCWRLEASAISVCCVSLCYLWMQKQAWLGTMQSFFEGLEGMVWNAVLDCEAAQVGVCHTFQKGVADKKLLLFPHQAS